FKVQGLLWGYNRSSHTHRAQARDLDRVGRPAGASSLARPPFLFPDQIGPLEVDMPISERVAFEPFGSLQGLLEGAPFRIFPTGTWYRDNRTLELTPARLKEFATNMRAGLPRFRVPINIEHDHGQGAFG